MAFSDDLRAFAEKANRNISVVTRKVALDMGNSLVQMSPVDTGRFRSNWVASISRVDTTTTDSTDNGAVGRIEMTLASPLGPNPNRHDYADVIYITNSLPYAQRLEYGWSKKAPAGMVRVTVTRFRHFVNAAAMGLK